VKDVYESERIAVPFTVGWVRPKICCRRTGRNGNAVADAVLAHEGAHARRHDNLVALRGFESLHFWFHPLAWTLQRKLAFLAEQACDEACVAELGDERYALLLLEMAVDRSQRRLRFHAMTMAAGSHSTTHRRPLQDGRDSPED
jgi:beta-lactamase regulating signal transducer with metallopeptidase domain